MTLTSFGGQVPTQGGFKLRVAVSPQISESSPRSLEYPFEGVEASRRFLCILRHGSTGFLSIASLRTSSSRH